ncbi:50S ribosomal protein L18 [Candidatus Sumerlaeota bacterium]|nr:50S ribosomal protein L18 [Candidatus Sumerlaeota bacterium]
MKRSKELRKEIRHLRIRKRIIGTAERPRLCIHKTLKHIYATVSDDTTNPEKGAITIASVSTNTKDMKQDKKSFCNIACAKKLGTAVGKILLEKGISQVVFDRAGYPYHGCVKTIAEAVRETGVRI